METIDYMERIKDHLEYVDGILYENQLLVDDILKSSTYKKLSTNEKEIFNHELHDYINFDLAVSLYTNDNPIICKERLIDTAKVLEKYEIKEAIESVSNDTGKWNRGKIITDYEKRLDKFNNQRNQYGRSLSDIKNYYIMRSADSSLTDNQRLYAKAKVNSITHYINTGVDIPITKDNVGFLAKNKFDSAIKVSQMSEQKKYSDRDKLKYYESRMYNQLLSERERQYAHKRVIELSTK